MTIITPGIDFLAPHLLRLNIPPALLAVAGRYLASTYNSPIPTWVLVSVSVLTVPVVSAAQIIWKSFKDRWDAATLGASLPPVFNGKSIGNLDILAFMRQQWGIGYPGLLSRFLIIVSAAPSSC